VDLGELLTYHLHKNRHNDEALVVFATLLQHVHAIAQVSPRLAIQRG
jgi:hypothetical protein